MSVAQAVPRPSTSNQTLPGRLRRTLWRILPIIGCLHAYIGWRLLSPLGLDVATLAMAFSGLVISTCLVPLGLLARFIVVRQALADRLSWLGGLAMGLFSSVLVLTVLRDIILLLVRAIAEQADGHCRCSLGEPVYTGWLYQCASSSSCCASGYSAGQAAEGA